MYIFLILALFLAAWGSDFWQGPQRVITPADLQQSQAESIANNFNIFSQAANAYIIEHLETLSSCGEIYTACEIKEIQSNTLMAYLPQDYKSLATWKADIQGNVLLVYALPSEIPGTVTPSMIATALHHQNNGQIGIGVVESGYLKSPTTTRGNIPSNKPDGTLAMIRQYGT